MYTLYSDLLKSNNPMESFQKQRPRDAILRKAMIREGIPDFPLDTSDASIWFPFLQEKTREIPELNIILIYKICDKELECKTIRSGGVYLYSTKEDAFNSITQESIEKYKIYSYKIDS